MGLNTNSYLSMYPDGGTPRFHRRCAMNLLAVLGSLVMIWLMAIAMWPSLPQDWNHYSIEAESTTAAADTTTQAKEPEFPSGAAVIIETRMTPNLVPLMLHFASVLGPGWPVVLYTPASSWSPPTSAALQRALAAGRIRVRHLPRNLTGFRTHASVSLFLAGPWLWDQLLGAPRVLMFQTDSVLCANANATVDDFARWDLVGAPIAPAYGAGYNGGLSLRNPRLMRDIVRRHGDEFRRKNGGPGAGGVASQDKFEDQWFYARAAEMGAALPPVEVAREFAVETVYFERPLGFHQPARWQADHMNDIMTWCPEAAMLEGQAKFGG